MDGLFFLLLLANSNTKMINDLKILWKTLLPVLLIVLNNLDAQAQQYRHSSIVLDSIHYHTKGDHVINVGVGLINPSDYAFNLIGGGSGSGEPSPSFNMNYEYGLTQEISIGPFFNYYRVDTQNDYTLDDINEIIDDPLCALACNSFINLPGSEDCICSGTIKERSNVFTFGGKLSFHKIIIEGLDTYASTHLGYSFNRRKTITESAISSILNELDSEVNVPRVVYYASVGIRYYIKPQLGIYGEFGYGNTHLLQLGASYRLGY